MDYKKIYDDDDNDILEDFGDKMFCLMIFFW